VQASVARCLRTPPYAAKRKDLSFDVVAALRSNGHRSIIVIGNYTIYADNGGSQPSKSITPLDVRRSYFDPLRPPIPGVLVESPGTAPGSDPCITCAFITIVPEGTKLI